MTKRTRNYIGKQFLIGADISSYEVSADKTNMAEIVKRFNLGQEIPQTLEEKHYEYSDIEKDDGSGNIITEEVLTDEVLNLIPITPNLDMVDEFTDSDDISELYSSATEKARGYVRGKRLEEKALNDKSTQDSIDKLKRLGFEVKETSTPVASPTSSQTVAES